VSLLCRGGRGDASGRDARRGPPAVSGYDSAVVIDDDALGDLLDEIGIGLELNSAEPALEPLLAALIGGEPPSALRTAAVEAVEALWDAELENAIRIELEGFRAEVVGEDPHWCRGAMARSGGWWSRREITRSRTCWSGVRQRSSAPGEPQPRAGGPSSSEPWDPRREPSIGV
jgi:hypothetical protein